MVALNGAYKQAAEKKACLPWNGGADMRISNGERLKNKNKNAKKEKTKDNQKKWRNFTNIICNYFGNNNMNDNKIVFKRQMFKELKSSRGGWNRKQLEALGVPWPLKAGWAQRLIGQTFTSEQLMNAKNAGNYDKKKPMLLEMIKQEGDEQIYKRMQDMEQRLKNLERLMILQIKEKKI
jgi:hypothetical protein